MKAKQRKSRIDTDVPMPDISRPRRLKKAEKSAKYTILQIEHPPPKTPTETKTPAISHTTKKRRRRSAAEIDRKFKCSVAKCPKAYGSEGSLFHHQRIKHPELAKVEAREKKESQVGTFLLPLHSNAPRNVSIRPATPLLSFVDPSTVNLIAPANAIASSSELLPPFAKAARCHLRSRSKSDPIASILKACTLPLPIPLKSTRNCRVRIPCEPVAWPLETTKSRSKSESFPEKSSPSCSLIQANSNTRSHKTVVPLPLNDSRAFEWHPTALSTTVSKDDEAIDKDILSVLAFGDANDPSYNFSPCTELNTTMIVPSVNGLEDCQSAKQAANCCVETKEPESEMNLTTLARLEHDWTRACHLSTHLERMSMSQIESTTRHRSTNNGVPVVASFSMARDGSQWFQDATNVPCAVDSSSELTCAVLDELLEREDLVEWKGLEGFENSWEVREGLDEGLRPTTLL